MNDSILLKVSFVTDALPWLQMVIRELATLGHQVCYLLGLYNPTQNSCLSPPLVVSFADHINQPSAILNIFQYVRSL